MNPSHCWYSAHLVDQCFIHQMTEFWASLVQCNWISHPVALDHGSKMAVDIFSWLKALNLSCFFKPNFVMTGQHVKLLWQHVCKSKKKKKKSPAICISLLFSARLLHGYICDPNFRKKPKTWIPQVLLQSCPQPRSELGASLCSLESGSSQHALNIY